DIRALPAQWASPAARRSAAWDAALALPASAGVMELRSDEPLGLDARARGRGAGATADGRAWAAVPRCAAVDGAIGDCLQFTSRWQRGGFGGGGRVPQHPRRVPQRAVVLVAGRKRGGGVRSRCIAADRADPAAAVRHRATGANESRAPLARSSPARHLDG